MKKKSETLKNKELKQKLIELIEIETNGDIRITDSSKASLGEIYSIPIYIDLEDYANEKLNEIVEENLEEILKGISEDDFIDTLSIIFLNLKEKEVGLNFKLSNRDSDGEECLNILVEY